MATPQDVPIRIRATQDHRRMLDELEVFWNETTSEVIRRAIETEHALLVAARQGPRPTQEFAHAHFDSVREQHKRRIEELAALRAELLGEDSPLVPASR